MKKNLVKRIFMIFAVVFFSIFCLGTAIINPIFIKDLPLQSCCSQNVLQEEPINFSGQGDFCQNNLSDYNDCYYVSAIKRNTGKNVFENNYLSYSNFDNRLEGSYNLPNFGELIRNLFRRKDETQIPKEKVYVYLGGYPLGFTINCKGVVVVAISNSNASQIQVGDVITKIENEEITSVTQILNIINSESLKGKNVKIEYVRKGETMFCDFLPVFDEEQRIYKLGLWVRDNSAGVGTLTYIRNDNLRFGALGHPVCDIDTGCLMPAESGNIFKCNIVGYKKGVRGNAGELRGLFLRNGSILGSLDKNNNFGVYGTFDKKFIAGFNSELVEVANRSEVKSGKAKIRCTIDGVTPKDYDIEIVKTYFQNSESNKSMFIRVTDERLLKTTGGIVQGMSGSPIIQNGKLVGAVTHVFVSDPTKGYGIYADWMINN